MRILILLFCLTPIMSYSQLLTSDVGATTSLVQLNAQMVELNILMKTVMKTSTTNQAENFGSRVAEQSQERLMESTEEALWKVPYVIKNSIIVKSVFKRGAEIFAVLDEFDDISDSNRGIEELPSVTEELYATTTGLMDMVTDLITDDIFKATDSERVNTINYVDKKMSEIELMVNRIKIENIRSERSLIQRDNQQRIIDEYNNN